MEQSIILDEDSHKKIVKQNMNLVRGSMPAPQYRVKEVHDCVKSILNEYNISCFKYYGDIFARIELLRFKFEISKNTKHNMLQDILDSVSKKFKVREISYIETDKSMIIIWM